MPDRSWRLAHFVGSHVYNQLSSPTSFTKGLVKWTTWKLLFKKRQLSLQVRAADMRTATANYEFGCSPLLEGQVLRLQCLVAYLLEKDEQVW